MGACRYNVICIVMLLFFVSIPPPTKVLFMGRMNPYTVRELTTNGGAPHEFSSGNDI